MAGVRRRPEPDRLRILVSNDDGYRAEGLQRLADALRPLATVTVVAPDRNRSGASNSLTLDVPLRVYPFGDAMYYVNGTPTDCVHLAIRDGRGRNRRPFPWPVHDGDLARRP